MKKTIAMFALGAVVMAGSALMTAQGPGGNQNNGQGGHPGNHQGGRPDNNQGNGPNRGNQGQQNFHFNDQDRNGFQQHYRGDVNRWQRQGNRRPQPNFRAGESIPRGYNIRPVPRSYYRGLQPPPPGYNYGYYDGYVVAYDPTTRIIADVLDIVAGATNRY